AAQDQRDRQDRAQAGGLEPRPPLPRKEDALVGQEGGGRHPAGPGPAPGAPPPPPAGPELHRAGAPGAHHRSAHQTRRARCESEEDCTPSSARTLSVTGWATRAGSSACDIVRLRSSRASAARRRDSLWARKRALRMATAAWLAKSSMI